MKLVTKNKHTENIQRQQKSPSSWQVGAKGDVSQAWNIRAHRTLIWGNCREQGGRGLGAASGGIPTLSIASHLCLCAPVLNVTAITRARPRTPPPPRTWLHSGQHACARPRTCTHSARLRGPDDCPTFLVPCSSSLPFSVGISTSQLGTTASAIRPLSGHGSAPCLSG